MKNILVAGLLTVMALPLYAAPAGSWRNANAQTSSAEKSADAFDFEGFRSAVKTNDLPLIKEVIKGKNLNINDADGAVPLIIAVQDGSYEVVELLIKSGASVNYQSRRMGMTPLCSAAYKQDIKKITLLLKYRADINKCSALGFLMMGDRDIPGYAEYLIQRGAHINVSGPFGLSPLAVAAAFGKPQSVTVLLKNKANINFVSSTITPLAAVVIKGIGKKGTYEMLDTLVRNGASLKLANQALAKGRGKDRTPLQLKYKVSNFKPQERQEAAKVIAYLNALPK